MQCDPVLEPLKTPAKNYLNPTTKDQSCEKFEREILRKQDKENPSALKSLLNKDQANKSPFRSGQRSPLKFLDEVSNLMNLPLKEEPKPKRMVIFQDSDSEQAVEPLISL